LLRLLARLLPILCQLLGIFLLSVIRVVLRETVSEMGRVGLVARVVSVLSVAVVLLFGYLEAGCQKSEVATCCQGRNNTCTGDGARLNDANSTQCFCDSDCMEIGDCCIDYIITCPGKIRIRVLRLLLCKIRLNNNVFAMFKNVH